MSDEHPSTIDFDELGEALEVDLTSAFVELDKIYADVDGRNTANTKLLDLPCGKGCDGCCHESVFLTPLEFLRAWHYAQQTLSPTRLASVVERGLALFVEHRAAILAFERPPPDGAADHYSLAKDLKFRCPLLGDDGACSVYPARELLGRVFGCSFNDEGGIYGCDLVGAHLAGKTVTLLPAGATARRLRALPLTFKRQVYPYYIQWLFGDPDELVL